MNSTSGYKASTYESFRIKQDYYLRATIEIIVKNDAIESYRLLLNIEDGVNFSPSRSHSIFNHPYNTLGECIEMLKHYLTQYQYAHA